MHTVPGIRCTRRDGNLLVEIPEQAVVDLVTKIDVAGEPSLDIEDREAFLDGIANRLPKVEAFHEDRTEQELRRLLRQAAYDAASHGQGAEWNQSVVD